MYATTPAYWHAYESPCWFLVATSLWSSYFSRLLATNRKPLTSRVHFLTMQLFVIFSIGSVFQIVCCGVVPRYAKARMRYKYDRISGMGSIGFRCWALALSVRQFLLIEEYDVETVLGQFAKADANEINFNVAIEPRLLGFNSNYNILYDLGHSKIRSGLLSPLLRLWCAIGTSGVTMKWMLPLRR